MGGKEEDDISGDIPEVDHISLYTLRIYFILSIPLMLSAGYTLSYVFTAGTVSHRCLIKECEDPADTILHPPWLSNAVPYVNNEPATCTRYNVLNSTDSCSTTEFAEETSNCAAWVYDPEELTILSEWDLTCDHNRWKLALPGTINNVGQFVGLIFSGYLSDRYGRRIVLTISTLISTIFGLIRAFSVNYEMFVAFEFLDATMATAIYGAGFVLGMEFVGPKKRVLVSTILSFMYAVGGIILAAYAMWLRSWRYIILAYYTPGLLVIALPWLVPESVRWLSSKGRVEEAEAVLRKVAAKNGVEVSEQSIRLIRNLARNIEQKKEREESISQGISPVKQVLSNRTIFVRLVICALCWIVTTFVYYGLSLSSVYVPGDKYINFMLVVSAEIPAHFFTWILTDYVGRKPTLSGSFFLSGVFCIITIFVPEHWWYLPLVVFLGGKLCITVAFSTMYIYTTEIFPTPLRHSLLAFCSMIGRFGSILAPQVPQLAIYMTSLPLLLYGITAVVASLLSLNFPETLGMKLPDTMDEATNIGKIKIKNSKTSDDQSVTSNQQL